MGWSKAWGRWVWDEANINIIFGGGFVFEKGCSGDKYEGQFGLWWDGGFYLGIIIIVQCSFGNGYAKSVAVR